MAPLTAMMGKGTVFKWGKEQAKAFRNVKAMVAQDTMVAPPKTGKGYKV